MKVKSESEVAQSCPTLCDPIDSSLPGSNRTYTRLYHNIGFPDDTIVKNLPANARDIRDVGSISESGRPPGVGKGNPLQL